MKSVRTVLRGLVVAVCVLAGASVTYAQPPLVANAGPATLTMCSNGQVTLGGNPTANGGQGPYSYLWAPATGLSSTTVANPVCTVNTTTTYTITVTDAGGATQTDNINVVVNAAADARLVLPGEFVPYAERSGAIRQIDRWVFARCVETLAAHGSHRCIAANLSARSLEDTSFPSFLADLLHHHDVDPRRMLIELTETSAIGETEAARRFIHALRALGCSVHLDDFGSGFSSFAQLRRLDVDAVKIDGAFIRDLRSETSNRLFVASMIDIAHGLGKRVVAEHVEDAETLEALRSLRVDLVQGYLLGRPAAELNDPPRPGALRVISDLQRKGSAEA